MQEDPPTDNVSQLLAGLKIDASSHLKKISSQNKIIETQNQSIQQLKTEFANMKMAFQTEIIKLHNIINSTEQQLTNADQGVNQRFEQLDNRLLDLHVSTANLSGPKGILDVPVHPHINFAGLPKETYQFVFFIQEALITSAG
jgi:predicted RNase H-like nuclease (RuvC/YqgF family)